MLYATLPLSALVLQLLIALSNVASTLLLRDLHQEVVALPARLASPVRSEEPAVTLTASPAPYADPAEPGLYRAGGDDLKLAIDQHETAAELLRDSGINQPVSHLEAGVFD